MNRKQRTMLARILAAAALLVALHFVPATGALRFLLYLVPYLVIGYDILIKAAKGIRNRQVFDENFLMALATVGAFFTGEYAEAVGVMLFYQVGELFQDYAVTRSRQSIAALMDIRPDTALVEGPDGTVTEQDPEDVAVGDTVVVKPGERVPLDGVVLTGPVTANMAEALDICYDAVAEPKLLIVCGSEACSGGLYAASRAVDRSFFERRHVDLWLPGAPTHPMTFIDGIRTLLRKKQR